MKAIKLSVRNYKVQFSEQGKTDNEYLTLDRMLEENENDYEIIYAIQDIIDSILDLKQSQSMYFQPNRDNKDSKGIITRIS